MKAKRLLALVLALVCAATVIPFTVNAVAVLPISSAEDLVDLMNDSSKWNGAYYLAADIDLAGKAQTPIGNADTAFTGYFDGMGHSITGLNISGESYLGLFGLIDGATVKNFTVSGEVVSEFASSASGASRAMAGGAVGAVTGNATLQGVTSTVTVTSNRQAAGGVVGSVFGSGNDVVNVVDCHYNGAVKGLRGIGGLIGIVSPGGADSDSAATNGVINVIDCTSAGTVAYVSTTSFAQCGGLIGAVLVDNGDGFAVNVVDCVNDAVVNFDSAAGAVKNTVGGIVGFVNTNTSDTGVVSVGGTVNFVGCVNNAAVTGAEYAGGIVALVSLGKLSEYYVNFIDCKNTGDVYASTVYAGGIVAGVAGGKVAIETCVNSGFVSAEMKMINTNRSYAGGIIGYASLDAGTGAALTIDIENCENNGKIQGIARNVGGIAGGLITKGVYTIKNCRNTGAVTGLIVGGIIGWTASSTSCTVSNCLNVGEIRNYSTAGGSVGSIFGYPQSNATVTDNYYLTGTAYDLKGVEQFGRGHTTNGSSTADVATAYVGVGSTNINTSLVVNGLNGSSDAWKKGTTYPELTALATAAERATVSEITNVSLSIGTDLSFNAFATLADGVADSKVVFTYAGESVEAEAVKDGELYRYTLEALPPQAMTELIVMELYVDGVVVDVARESIRGYCEQLIDSDESSDALKQLAKDILVYGTAAQLYTDYNLDSLADVEIVGATEFEELYTSTASSVVGTDVEGVKINGVGVRFDYVNNVFFTFTAPSLDGITVTVNGAPAEIEPYGNGYIVYSAPIAATEFDSEVVAVLASDGTAVQTVTYSVACFVYEMQNDANAEAAALARALYNYGESAAAYAGN